MNYPEFIVGSDLADAKTLKVLNDPRFNNPEVLQSIHKAVMRDFRSFDMAEMVRELHLLFFLADVNARMGSGVCQDEAVALKARISRIKGLELSQNKEVINALLLRDDEVKYERAIQKIQSGYENLHLKTRRLRYADDAFHVNLCREVRGNPNKPIRVYAQKLGYSVGTIQHALYRFKLASVNMDVVKLVDWRHNNNNYVPHSEIEQSRIAQTQRWKPREIPVGRVTLVDSKQVAPIEPPQPDSVPSSRDVVSVCKQQFLEAVLKGDQKRAAELERALKICGELPNNI